MALFLVQTRKAINTGGITAKWSNRYFVQSDTESGAVAMGQAIWNDGERLFHNALAFCYSIYVNNMADAPNTPGLEIGVPTGVQRGARAATAVTVGTMLPLFNVIRVDFPVLASRPSRKFYRIPLLEGDIQDAQPGAALLSDIQAGCDVIASNWWMQDPDAQSYAGTALVKGITSRRLGRDAAVSVPIGPAFG